MGREGDGDLVSAQCSSCHLEVMIWYGVGGRISPEVTEGCTENVIAGVEGTEKGANEANPAAAEEMWDSEAKVIKWCLQGCNWEGLGKPEAGSNGLMELALQWL